MDWQTISREILTSTTLKGKEMDWKITHRKIPIWKEMEWKGERQRQRKREGEREVFSKWETCQWEVTSKWKTIESKIMELKGMEWETMESKIEKISKTFVYWIQHNKHIKSHKIQDI